MNLNPLPNSLRVQETEVAEPLSRDEDTAHNLSSIIAGSVGGDSTTNSFNCQTKNKSSGYKPPRKFK